MHLNLFMQHLLSLITQDSCTPKEGRFGHDWNQKHMKKIEKIFIENQIFDTSMQRLLTQISTLIHWHT